MGRSIAPTLLALALIAVIASCRVDEPDPRCVAREHLRAALVSVEWAVAAVASADPEAGEAAMAAVDRHVRSARASLTELAPELRDGPTARRLTEAANYLAFVVADHAISGVPDGALARFAAREVRRAAPGVAADAPFGC